MANRESFILGDLKYQLNFIIKVTCLVILTSNNILSLDAQAQIQEDQSFGQNSTTLKRSQNNHLVIEGGERRGKNLFHRFRSFSVNAIQNTGLKNIYFINPEGVGNIFSLVTGTKATILNNSNINVTLSDLRKPGNANLYFVNPNGIHVGKNTSFNLNGNLFLSSADQIIFGEVGQIDLKSQASVPLLSIDPTEFSFRGNAPGRIKVESSIEASKGKGINILGGNIELQGARLLTQNSQIVLKSLSKTGSISLEKSHQSGIVPGSQRGNITLENGSSIIAEHRDTSSVSGNIIELSGHDITLRDGSRIETVNATPNSSLDIRVDASGIIKVDGSVIGTSTIQEAGNDNVKSGRIFLDSQLLDVKGSIQFLDIGGPAPIPVPLPSVIGTGQSLSDGDIVVQSNHGIHIGLFSAILTDGSIEISVPHGNVQLSNRGAIGPNSIDSGQGGNVSLDVSGKVQLGSDPSNTEFEDFGIIRSNQNISIKTSILELWNQSNLNTVTFSQTVGKSGNIDIFASDKVFLQGSAQRPELSSSISASTGSQSEGIAGDVSIITPQLEIRDGASIRVGSNEGQAGKLVVNSRSLLLEQGELTAQTGENTSLRFNNANIILNISDEIQLKNDSQITAETMSRGNGGNILILNTPRLNATNDPDFDVQTGNDITAIAPQGQGGNIIINAQEVNGFGLPNDDADNIIATGLRPGFVDVDTTTELDQGAVELPEVVIDPNSLVAQNPCSRGADSEFTLSGRGGLPGSTNSSLSNTQSKVDFIESAAKSKTSQDKFSRSILTEASNPKLDNKSQPAQGWVYDRTGNIKLIAYQSQLNPENIRESKFPQACPS